MTRAVVAALFILLAQGGAQAAESTGPAAEPLSYAFFVQRGVGEKISAVSAGFIRRLPWAFFDGRLSTHGELWISRWDAHEHHPSDSGALLQLGLKPVLRYTFAQSQVPWFAEGGIGLTFTSEIYRKNERQFSTAYNFGDHIGVGLTFGPRHENEIALRIEHFSNGNLKLPNPGENFRELRYVRWFD